MREEGARCGEPRQEAETDSSQQGVFAKSQRVPKSRSLKNHREEVGLRQGTDHSEDSHSQWSPSGPGLVFKAHGALDTAAFPRFTEWGHYCAEKRLSQGQRGNLSSHLPAVSDHLHLAQLRSLYLNQTTRSISAMAHLPQRPTTVTMIPLNAIQGVELV